MHTPRYSLTLKLDRERALLISMNLKETDPKQREVHTNKNRGPTEERV